MRLQKLRHAAGFCFGNGVYQVAFDETDAVRSKKFKPGSPFGIRYMRRCFMLLHETIVCPTGPERYRRCLLHGQGRPEMRVLCALS